MAKETTKMVSSITLKVIDNYEKFVPATLKVYFVRVCVRDCAGAIRVGSLGNDKPLKPIWFYG